MFALRFASGAVSAGVIACAAVPVAAEQVAKEAAPTAAPSPTHMSLWDTPRPVVRPATSRPLTLGDPISTFLSLNADPEGDLPREVAYTPDGEQILVVHRDTDNVTFFDVDSQTATATVAVGDFPVDVAVAPDGSYAVVPNVLSNDVSIIDLGTQTVEATVPVTGEQPFSVEITSDSTTAVVAVITDGSTSRFSIIDLATATETTSFPSTPQGAIGFFFSPEIGVSGNLFSRFALAPDGSTIVLPDAGNGVVTLYDLAGNVMETLNVAASPRSVDVSADSTTAVVGHEGTARTITEIDLVNQVVSGAFSVSENLRNQTIRITPDKSHAIAAISNQVIFVNLTSGNTTATISTGTVGDIEISFDGQYAFVSNFNARVIDISSQVLVDTVSFAPCVEAATSPTELRAVALNNRFREDVHFYNIDGASSFLEDAVVSGPPPEGDATYAVDISADGSIAVACNLVSRNVSIIELPAGTVRSYVDVGDRVKEVRITPDGAYAVVCAMDANNLVIIDLSTDEVVAELAIFNRPGRVRISPDSEEAYVLNVAGTDRISFVDLDGENSSIIVQRSAGQTGSANGYTYTETSGIELSDDGSVLAVCDSFNDLLRIFDTASRTQIDAVTVGDFPIRAAFSPSGDRIYVTNAFGDSVSVVENDQGVWSNIGTVPNIDFPLTVNVDAGDTYVYVGNSGSNPAVRVIDTGSLNVVGTLPFADGSPRDTHLCRAQGTLYVAATNGELVRIDAAGAGSSIIDATPLESGPSDLAFNEATQTAMTAQPVPDGVDIVTFGMTGDIDGDGDVDVDDLLLLLSAWGTNDPDADLDGSGTVDVDDLLLLLSNWG